MLQAYFKSLYESATSRAYESAFREIAAAIGPDSAVLDCGAHSGRIFDVLAKRSELAPGQYHGIEWSAPLVAAARQRGLNVTQGDLNKGMDEATGTYSCVYALSVLEHLLNPCRFLKECHRVLRPGGVLVLLTPNISTYFTAVLILLGKMPSSGPHPDSDQLVKAEEIFKVSHPANVPDTESDTPVHRHLIVFSYRVLRNYLRLLGFTEVTGHGFGLYPLPNFIQPVAERLDPYHCHQMVFVARKN